MATTIEESPYLNGLREWENRNSAESKRRWNWQIMAFLAMVALVAAECQTFYYMTRPKYVPYPVLLDNIGNTVAAGYKQNATPEQWEQVRRNTMQAFVEQLRALTSDSEEQKRKVDNVFAHVGESTQARAVIDDFYKKQIERVTKESVQVQVRTVLPSTDRTYQVEWVETARDQQGVVKSTDTWRGYFKVATVPQGEERAFLANPLGMYVTEISWSKVI